MNREELKQMWFNSPKSSVVTRTIKLDVEKGTVQITSDSPDGFRQFTTQQKFPFTYLVEREEYKSGEYELLIKLTNGIIV
tara:strand:- start:594 stop:833 length:240 start_codon:yes stop_codon:yes gene_type:complete